MKRFLYKSTSLLCLAMVSASALFSCQPEEFTPSAELKATQVSNWTAKQFVDGWYIVVFKKNRKTTQELINSLVVNGVITPISNENVLDGGIQGFIAYLTAAQVAYLKQVAFVDYIEQDQDILAMEETVTKTHGPKNKTTTEITQIVPQGVAMMGYADGTGKTAWIIDSGVDVNNTDLNVDVARSKSFLSSTASIQDGFGQGTMVAGIIGAKNNDSGVIGIAPNTSIVALRIMDNDGAGTATAAIKALNHVNTYGTAGDVVNISIKTEPSLVLDELVKAVAAKGIFVAIAAGNKNLDCSIFSPQRVDAPNVYTVSAMDYKKSFWGASNFGLPVDRCAPGVAITSLAVGGGIKTATSTSYAAPHVAGLLLLKGNNMGNIGYVTGDKDKNPDLIPHL